ncbi:hypothetical protein [Pseudonocardia sp. TMWB2A]|uniref:hypothetical protein n=1 Tax=Pseudonocardia sp. TMWB2A TaxID=687430 RepID=UPI00307CFC01
MSVAVVMTATLSPTRARYMARYFFPGLEDYDLFHCASVFLSLSSYRYPHLQPMTACYTIIGTVHFTVEAKSEY